MARLYIGTSGFSYREWQGVLYPEGLPAAQYLTYYAERFNAVEINASFYRMPALDTLNKWANQVPEGFRFVFKMNRQITHNHRLKPEGDEYLSLFIDRLSSMGPKLGPILFQFPPQFQLDLPRLQRTLALLSPQLHFAFEFRHQSWDEPRVHNLLQSSGATWCVADTENSPINPQTLLPQYPFVYVRLRQEYPRDQLSNWAVAIRRWLDIGLDVYAFFKHEDSGTGPQYAAELQNLLSPVPAI